MNTEFYFEAVSVVGTIAVGGEITLQRFIWRGQTYPVLGMGRQWLAEEGRHVLVETINGMRVELQLRREDLGWYLRRVWRSPAATAA